MAVVPHLASARLADVVGLRVIVVAAWVRGAFAGGVGVAHADEHVVRLAGKGLEGDRVPRYVFVGGGVGEGNGGVPVKWKAPRLTHQLACCSTIRPGLVLSDPPIT